MLPILLATAWLAICALGVAAMRHRGHDAFGWAILFMFLGPLALPLAVSADRHRPPQPETPTRSGRVDVLVALNDPLGTTTAVESALNLLGAHLTSVTLAAVVDLEARSTVRGHDTLRQAQARLDALAGVVVLMTSAPVDTVILHGEPATTLQRYAADHAYDLIIAANLVGRRSRHESRRAARAFAARSPVPVLVSPVPVRLAPVPQQW